MPTGCFSRTSAFDWTQGSFLAKQLSWRDGGAGVGWCPAGCYGSTIFFEMKAVRSDWFHRFDIVHRSFNWCHFHYPRPNEGSKWSGTGTDLASMNQFLQSIYCSTFGCGTRSCLIMGPSGIGKSSLLRPGWVENLLLQLAHCFAISIFDVILYQHGFTWAVCFPYRPTRKFYGTI